MTNNSAFRLLANAPSHVSPRAIDPQTTTLCKNILSARAIGRIWERSQLSARSTLESAVTNRAGRIERSGAAHQLKIKNV